MSNNIKVPNHIGIIMDGNGRWAKNKNMPKIYGHRAGADTLRKIIISCSNLNIKFLTVYAFSTENWRRSTDEVSGLMKLFKKYIASEGKKLKENKIRFMVSGRKEGVDPSLLKAIDKLTEETSIDYVATLNIAFNYGGRGEIIDAIKKAKELGEEITENNFSKFMYNNLPDPELIIRTSGEFRISNFLLWQIAYSEIYVTDTLWPDFDEAELLKAIEDYSKRERRFGGRIND